MADPTFLLLSLLELTVWIINWCFLNYLSLNCFHFIQHLPWLQSYVTPEKWRHMWCGCLELGPIFFRNCHLGQRQSDRTCGCSVFRPFAFSYGFSGGRRLLWWIYVLLRMFFSSSCVTIFFRSHKKNGRKDFPCSVCVLDCIVLCYCYCFVCTNVGLLPPGESPIWVSSSSSSSMRVWRLLANRSIPCGRKMLWMRPIHLFQRTDQSLKTAVAAVICCVFIPHTSR